MEAMHCIRWHTMAAFLYFAIIVLLCPMAQGKFAYVSLLINDEFLPAVRVLGRNLNATLTMHDFLAMVTSDVSEAAVDTLRHEGWIVKTVPTVTGGAYNGHWLTDLSI